MGFKFLNRAKTKKVEQDDSIQGESIIEEDYEQPNDEYKVDRSKLVDSVNNSVEEQPSRVSDDTLFTSREQVLAHQASTGHMTSFGDSEGGPSIRDLNQDNLSVSSEKVAEPENQNNMDIKTNDSIEDIIAEVAEPVVEDVRTTIENKERTHMDSYSNVTVTTDTEDIKRGVDIYNEVQPNHIVTEVSPSGLGFPEGVSVRKLNFALLDSEPLIVTEFVDNYGELSRQIEQFEDKLHLSVIPLEVCGFRLPVSNLKNHEVVEINGVRCTSGTTRIVNRDMLNSLIRDVATVVKANGTYTLDLEKEYKIGGKKYMLRLLNNFEVTKLLNGFRNFPIDYYEASNGYVKIIINPKRALTRGGNC